LLIYQFIIFMYIYIYIKFEKQISDIDNDEIDTLKYFSQYFKVL